MFLALQGSQLVYTVGRLVQGLASSRQCARHGFYVTLIALLNATTSSQLSDQLVLDLVEKRLQIKGSKSVSIVMSTVERWYRVNPKLFIIGKK